MTLDVHHPSPADVDPFGEGVSARSCRQRANESDKSQQFHDDVFHGCSLFRLQLTCSMSGNFHKSHPVIFYCARRAKTLMQINCESRRSQSSVAVPVSALPPKPDIRHCELNVRFVPKADIVKARLIASKIGADKSAGAGQRASGGFQMGVPQVPCVNHVWPNL